MDITQHPTSSPRRFLLSGEWPPAMWWALAAGLLGMAVQIRDGMYHLLGFVWLTLAIIAIAFSLVARPQPHRAQSQGTRRRMIGLLSGLILLQFVQFYAYPLPGSSWTSGPQIWKGWHKVDWLFYGLLTFAATANIVVIIAAVRGRERFVRRIGFPIALVAFLAMGVWIIRVVPKPEMDVWWAQKAGIEAFVRGQSPYTSSFPDIHKNPAVYAPGIVKDGRVHLGFPYPPVVLWMDLPGHLLTGDYRYSNLLAMLGTALLIAYVRPGVIGALAALLFLFTPRVLFVLESGWTEPLSAVLLAGLVWLASHRSWWTPILLGIFLASKQYHVIIAPCALLLIDRPWRIKEVARWVALAGASALIVSLPLVLWDLNAFMRSAVQQAGASPLRTDAMSYLALWKVNTRIEPPTWLGFLAGLLATVCVLRRLRPGGTNFAIGITIVLLAFFALGKFAFCNYFYFLIAALCMAVATMPDPQEPHAAQAELRGNENVALQE